MVYESRVGDVFVLGASSWRIEDITADQVLVSPAPGQPGKLPFWHGDALGRPAELGRAIGAYCRELGAAGPADATARLRADGLDELAAAKPGQLPDRAARGDRLRARRPDPGARAVPGRARRLAAGAAQPVRRPGARAVGAGHRGPAARPLRRHGRAGAAHRRRDRDPGAGRRRAAAGRASPCSTPTRSSSWSPPSSAQLGPVRVPVPGVRRAGAAAAAAAAGPAHPAVAAAAAIGPAARGGQPVRHVPDRAGDACGSACRTCSTCPA